MSSIIDDSVAFPDDTLCVGFCTTVFEWSFWLPTIVLVVVHLGRRKEATVATQNSRREQSRAVVDEKASSLDGAQERWHSFKWSFRFTFFAEQKKDKTMRYSYGYR